MNFRTPFLALSALAAPACRPAETPPPELLRLELVRPKNPDGVYLNEELIFDFSGEIDPLSVTKTSLRIEAEEGGEAARGEFLVRGNRIRFLPEPVLDPDLTGGGYQPGTRYVVTFLGFPQVDGIRGESGVPLAETVRWAFATVDPSPWPRSEFVFADSSPESCAPLRLLTERISPGQPIVLACDEPLDPSSLRSSDFELSETRGSGEEKTERVILLQASLQRNEEERSGDPNAGALILLRPRELLDQKASYTFSLKNEQPDLVDFAGNRVPRSAIGLSRRIYVDPPNEVGPSDVLRESFVDDSRELPLQIEGFDGTASWGDSGVVTLRYPAAAGDGRDGRVRPSLSGRSTFPYSLQAFAIDVPRSSAVSLANPSNPDGMAILRAQGKIEIQGTLQRLAPSSEPVPMTFAALDAPPIEAEDWLADRVRFAQEAGDEGSDADAFFLDLSLGLERTGTKLPRGVTGWNALKREASDMRRAQGTGPEQRTWRQILGEFLEGYLPTLPPGGERSFLVEWREGWSRSGREWPTLSSWLDRAQQSEVAWTVVIAGGDLIVAPGATLDCGTPLLLCAGGRLRVYGQVRAPEIWVLGEGGGSGLRGRQDAELTIDEPSGNPLVEPLRYAVLSQSLPSVGGPVRWISAQALGQARGGDFKVSYLRAFQGARFDPTEHELSYSPALMEQPARIRFLVELEIYSFDEGSGSKTGLRSWSPPFVDEIVLVSEPVR